MLKNYLKILFRDLKRNKGYTFINIFGLAVGLACCILIAMYVRDELSHEDFQKKGHRIMVVASKYSFSGRGRTDLSTPYPLAGTLKKEAPSVANAVTMLWPTQGEVSLDGEHFQEEEGVFHAEKAFFEIFSFPILKGSLEDFGEPNTVIISTKLANEYFPNDNPIGKTMTIKERGQHVYRVVAVAKSHSKSYLDFSAVLSFSTTAYPQTHADSWGSSMFQTYVLLKKGASVETFKKQVDKIAKAHLGNLSTGISYVVQPLPGLYLSNLISTDGFHGRWRYLYIFGAIALFILIIAFVNYVNLSTARAAQRAKEVGVRKTTGANRFQLVRQFLGEALILSAVAYILALGIAQLALPVFNQLFGMKLSFVNAGFGWFIVLGIATLCIGLLAGSYPALYLSAFKPRQVLKGHGQSGGSGTWLRKSLIIVQFTTAIALIIGTAVVYYQLQFVQHKDIGFEGEQVVVTHIPQDGSVALRREILAQPGVVTATITNGIPGRFRISMFKKSDGVSSEARVDTSKQIRIYPATVDYKYIETLDMEMAAGRQFSKERTSDKERALIINQTAAKALGWKPKEAIGKPIKIAGGGKIIGVVKDFHISSLRKPIEPVILSLRTFSSVSSTMSLAIRLKQGKIQAGLRQVEEVRSQFTDEPFTYTFLDDEFVGMYKTARRLGQVFGGFAVIAIILACLGLFGLAAFSAQRRTKEIGIRKVMGATVTNIVGLLSKDFLKLVLIGFVIAIPIAYYAMNQWLQDFAYRIEIGAGIFLLAGGLALLIALATVSWQSIRAALANPVESLRSE